MRKQGVSYKIRSYIFLLSLCALMGCVKESDNFSDERSAEIQASEEITQKEEISEEKIAQVEESSTEGILQASVTKTDGVQEETTEPVTVEVDLSDCFDEIKGSAVIYDPTENCYQIYDPELALTRRSPCSTFKIISSLIALENGIIEPDDSIRPWSGEIFWNEEWNRDIDFSDAFHASCVWYFREVIDEIGKDMIQKELDRLEYGNCDISDWEGGQNTNNNNPVLTGFWIESSLLISPKEQVEVLERIFGDKTVYSEETLDQLMRVMLLTESNEQDILIYGKTGMGMAHGIVVDAWYTGFADTADKRIYFCVYLGETDNADVSSAKAREIAVKIVSDYLAVTKKTF